MRTTQPELPMQVYARDSSSVMTPYGAIITAMAQLVAAGRELRRDPHL